MVPQGSSAPNRTVPTSIRSLLCRQVEEGRAAWALAFLRPVATPIASHGDVKRPLWQESWVISAAIAAVAAWCKVFRGVVAAVVVQMVHDQSALAGSASDNPCDKIPAGVAWMGARSDLFVKNGS